jgi:branched-chain amino acid transport system permease protein
MSLNVLAGYAGLVSVCHAAFFGIGAYTTALLSLKLGVPFLLNTAAGAVLSGFVALFIAWPSLRTHDDYFVIMTFAFQIIIFSIINNWLRVTGGPIGLAGIPQPELFGIKISSHAAYFMLIFVFCMLVYLFLSRVTKSPFGQILKAIREDEIFATSLAKDTLKFKVVAFVLGAAVASIGGSLYASYITFIDPTSFTIMESIFILSIVIIGGAGNLKGSIVGSALLVSIPEILRFVGMSSDIASNMRQIIYGVLIVVFMMYRPQGFFGEMVSGKQQSERKER